MSPPSARKLHVVIAANAYFPADKEGGPPFSNRELAEALARAGATVKVVTTDRNGSSRLEVPVNQWTDVGGVHVYYARTRSGSWAWSRDFRTAIRSALRSADVCIMSAVFWNYTGIASWLECRRAGVPYITYVRGLLSSWALRHKGAKKSAYWSLCARRIVDGSKAIVALAEQEAEDLRRIGTRPPVVVIPNGAPRLHVDDEASTAGCDQTIGPTAHRTPYILFLSRVHPKKGLDILIPAFEAAIARGISARLVIAGPVDPAYSNQFSRMLNSCRVRDRIDVVGSKSGREKASLFTGALAFVLPWYGEGLPVAVLEAMSTGTPVVITPGCNLPEVAASGAGLQVDPSIESLTEGLVRIVEDDQLRAQCISNARKLIEKSFSWDAIARRVIDLCGQIATTSADKDSSSIEDGNRLQQGSR